MKRPRKVAIQGERGAFSHEAAHYFLGDQIEVVPCVRFDDVFRGLTEKKFDAAVIPIENTLHGSVHENYDHLLNFDLDIIAETHVRIVHNLIAPPGVTFRQIRRVLSHPVALNQCLNFFARNPQIEKTSEYDTAGAVKIVVEKNMTDAAAIASDVAAEIHGGHILKRSIEDDHRNYTRFFLLRRPGSRRLPHNGGIEWKTSLVFSTRNVPGMLFRALSAFALRDLNMTKIESRPLRGKPWEYLFYLDFLGSVKDERVQKALGHLKEVADFMRVLGCYPRGA
jgi:prephenate dehydratase